MNELLTQGGDKLAEIAAVAVVIGLAMIPIFAILMMLRVIRFWMAPDGQEYHFNGGYYRQDLNSAAFKRQAVAERERHANDSEPNSYQ